MDQFCVNYRNCTTNNLIIVEYLWSMSTILWLGSIWYTILNINIIEYKMKLNNTIRQEFIIWHVLNYNTRKYGKYLKYDIKHKRVSHFSFLLNSANLALLLSTILIIDAKKMGNWNEGDLAKATINILRQYTKDNF